VFRSRRRHAAPEPASGARHRAVDGTARPRRVADILAEACATGPLPTHRPGGTRHLAPTAEARAGAHRAERTRPEPVRRGAHRQPQRQPQPQPSSVRRLAWRSAAVATSLGAVAALAIAQPPAVHEPDAFADASDPTSNLPSVLQRQVVIPPAVIARAKEVARQRDQAAAAARIARERRDAAARATRAAQRNPKGAAQQLAADRGWAGAQWDCLEALWTRESSWDYTATNASSGAYGIAQALPATKYHIEGPDWRNNPVTQIRWGLKYVGRNYGSPCAAWDHETGYGWY
jgi:hypothetical protein